MMVSTAGACDPPPPPGWVAPTLQSAEISTTEVVAGTTFTVSASATDDHQISYIALRFLTKRAVDPLRVPCTESEWTPGPEVNVEFTCTMPLIAGNGAWTLDVVAYDGEWSGPHGACGCDSERLSLTVTGGSDDSQPPVQESAIVTPDPIAVGSESTLTVRMSDDHLGDYSGDPIFMTYSPDGRPARVCTQVSQTRVSPTEHEWVFNCPASPKAGTFLAIGYFRDAMGYLGEMRIPLTFVENL